MKLSRRGKKNKIDSIPKKKPKKLLRRVLGLGLSATSLLGASACGGKSNTGSSTQGTSNSTHTKDSIDTLQQKVHVVLSEDPRQSKVTVAASSTTVAQTTTTVKSTEIPHATIIQSVFSQLLKRSATKEELNTISKLADQVPGGTDDAVRSAIIQYVRNSPEYIHAHPGEAPVLQLFKTKLGKDVTPEQAAPYIQLYESQIGADPAAVVEAKLRADDPYNYYGQIVRAAGGEVNVNGLPTVLALRNGIGSLNFALDDVFVILEPNRTVSFFNGATHPSGPQSSLSPDVNHDGRPDVGEIMAGNYVLIPRGIFHGHQASRVMNRPTPGVFPTITPQNYSDLNHHPGWRNLNGDRTFDPFEQSFQLSLNQLPDDILVHVAGASAGCFQVINIDAFQSILLKYGGNAWLTVANSNAPQTWAHA